MATKHQPDRVVGGRSNDERAYDAGAALFEYGSRVYYSRHGEAIETALQDLFTDLHHFVAAMGFEDPIATMKEALKNGCGNYNDEAFEGEPHMDDEHSEEPPFAEEPWCAPEDWMIYYRRRLWEDEDE